MKGTEHNNHNEDVLESLSEDIKEIKDNITNLRTDMQQYNTIRIKNGGGRKILFERDEFFQMLYDKGKFKNAVRDISWWIERAVPFFTLIGVLYAVFSK